MDNYIPISKIFVIGREVLQRKFPFILELESYLCIVFSHKVRSNNYVLCVQFSADLYTPISLRGTNSNSWEYFCHEKGREYFVNLFNNIVVYTGYEVTVHRKCYNDENCLPSNHCLEIMGQKLLSPDVMVRMIFFGNTVYYFESEDYNYGYIEGEKSSYFFDAKPETYEQRILYAYVISKLG